LIAPIRQNNKKRQGLRDTGVFLAKALTQRIETPISIRQIRQSGLQLKHAVAQERQ
jgi:hypothetical protein